ncbi:LysM peptidoglycan-binding domain-containing protein [Streptomyces sp. SudanB52_2052]|uniref:LysM peptidoglycan-binding domain-containing protein n=1 Tax=Streptomyces sp. SudanB52_2052 TaxID=3035276 RepID=UPI003F5718A9
MTGIVSVVVGAILGVQGSSPAAAPAPAPVVVEETPDALPKRAPVTPRKPATVTKVVLGPGDTLSALAERHGTTVKKLQRLNGLGTSTLIYAGDTLRIRPAPSTATDPEIVPVPTRLSGLSRTNPPPRASAACPRPPDGQ